jgi:hypothetical protein
MRLGSAPVLDEVIALDLTPDEVALERRLLDWEEARQPTPGPRRGHLDWFDPRQPCALLLLPTPMSDEVPAYLSFYGAEGTRRHSSSAKHSNSPWSTGPPRRRRSGFPVSTSETTHGRSWIARSGS